MPSLSFLELPAEIRRAIYHHHLPVRRLATHQLLDPDFKIVTPEGREIPDLLFVSKQVYEEASAIFYCKAILELAPPRPPSFSMFSALTLDADNMNAFDLSGDLDDEFFFLPPRLLRLVTTVHIFSDQRDAISAESYESTLKWLATNTNVQRVDLSRRLMCRLRKSRVTLLPLQTLATVESIALRVFRVYAHAAPSTWEMTRRFEVQAILKKRLQVLQTFCFVGAEDALQLQAEPRLDLRKSDDDERLELAQETGKFLDALAEKEITGKDPRIGLNYDNLDSWEGLGRAGAIPPVWLYQLVFVSQECCASR